MKKFIFRIVLVLVLLVIVGIVVVAMSLDRIVKAGVETVGPQIAKVEIKLDKASLSPLSGKGELTGLVVGNPAGYKTETAIKAGSIRVAVDPMSVFSKKTVVKSVDLGDLDITLEGSPNNNNLTKILANIDASLAGAPANTTQPPPRQSEKTIQVDDLKITNAKLHVVMPGAGGKSTTVPIPTIHLTNLGTDSKGISTAELSKLVISAVLDGSLKAAGAAITEFGKEMGEKAAAAGKSAMESAEKAAGKAAEKAMKGVGDLFKKTQ